MKTRASEHLPPPPPNTESEGEAEQPDTKMSDALQPPYKSLDFYIKMPALVKNAIPTLADDGSNFLA